MQLAIRDAIVADVNAAFILAYPTVPLVHKNAPFDRNTPPEEWVEFEVKFMDAQQVGMNLVPRTRLKGFVYVSCWARSGTGSRRQIGIVDWFAAQLGYRTIGGAVLQAPQPTHATAPTGWEVEMVKFYFYTAPQ